jgi:hypothetical protein
MRRGSIPEMTVRYRSSPPRAFLSTCHPCFTGINNVVPNPSSLFLMRPSFRRCRHA